MTDADIINKVLDTSNRINSILIKKLTNEEIEYINNRFSDGIDSLKDGLYRMLHKIEEKPKCYICGKYRHYDAKTCGSSECLKEHRRNINIKKYGGPSPFCLRKIQESAKKTKLEKYGHENYSNWEKSKKTCLEKYGATSWFQSAESKNRLKEKYGVEYGLQSRKIWEQTRKSTIEKYGCAYNKKQLNKTLQEKYGVNWFTQHKKLIEATHSKESEHKRYLTRKQNAIYKSSKEEIKTDEILRKIFSDLIHIYKDKERYPFECDFYIPSLDLFIECQYHWTHNGHPYNENNLEDVEIVNFWRSKNTQYFNVAIDVWTKRDPLKRKIAKENNLNWIEFWSIDEVKEWLNNFEKS